MHASPISEAPSCKSIFFLHLSTCPPSQSRSYPTPSIICLRRRPLCCGSVPRYCSQHTGIVHVIRREFPSRLSRRSRHGTQFPALDRSIPPSWSACHRRSLLLYFYLQHCLLPPIFVSTPHFINFRDYPTIKVHRCPINAGVPGPLLSARPSHLFPLLSCSSTFSLLFLFPHDLLFL